MKRLQWITGGRGRSRESKKGLRNFLMVPKTLNFTNRHSALFREGDIRTGEFRDLGIKGYSRSWH